MAKNRRPTGFLMSFIEKSIILPQLETNLFLASLFSDLKWNLKKGDSHSSYL